MTKFTAWVDARIDRFADRLGDRMVDAAITKSGLDGLYEEFGSFLLGLNDGLGKL